MKSTTSTAKSKANDTTEHCKACNRTLAENDRALFVEEEVGRIFCSEQCIADFFGSDVARLEKEYFKYLSKDDLSGEEKEKLAHLRWITLQEPDEVWRQKTLAGDYRFTLISEFQPGSKPVWSICICLFLRGEPSFLFLAFVTANPAMAEHYRRGERVEWTSSKAGVNATTAPQSSEDEAEGEETPGAPYDGLADSWTAEESLRAELMNLRQGTDIQEKDFDLYQSCVEPTLEEPDEVWTFEPSEGQKSAGVLLSAGNVKVAEERKIYHFVKRFEEEDGSEYWYVIIAQQSEDQTTISDEEEQIEVLEAFPTRDAHIVEHCRRGQEELSGHKLETSNQRTVH